LFDVKHLVDETIKFVHAFLENLDETIAILTEKAFRDNWFNSTYNLNISEEDLVDLLNVSTKGQLFQFNGALYEQTDGVAMKS